MFSLNINIVLLISLASFISSLEIVPSNWREWEDFKMTHKKVYRTHEEEVSRMKLFSQNLIEIAKHNALFASGQKSYSMKMNHFGDMTREEVSRMVNGVRGTRIEESQAAGQRYGKPFVKRGSQARVPKAIDWRKKGAVTDVHDQGPCGSCWAFSTVGSIEGQYFLKTGELVDLSEQQLVDCSYQNSGCSGGWMIDAFKDLIYDGGLESEKNYPYVASERYCKFNETLAEVLLTDYVSIPMKDEEALQEAVGTEGPVSVAIDASYDSFHYYDQGIYDEEDCSWGSLSHAVLAVGYDTDENGVEYWIVKNSWGTGWGEEGYVRIVKNKNMCGIATMASYPVL